MRIYSKFKDYYDITESLGFDSSITLIRKQKILTDNIKIEDFIYWSSYCSFEVESLSISGIIGFCGKIYPMFMDDEIQANKIEYDFNNKIKTIESRFPKHITKKQIRNWNKKIKHKLNRWNTIINSDANLLFLKYQVPYFFIDLTKHTDNLVLYPILSQYNFMSVINAYETHQQIEQYMTNELVTNNNVNSERTDECIAKSNGFNRYSFRNNKTTKLPKKF